MPRSSIVRTSVKEALWYLVCTAFATASPLLKVADLRFPSLCYLSSSLEFLSDVFQSSSVRPRHISRSRVRPRTVQELGSVSLSPWTFLPPRRDRTLPLRAVATRFASLLLRPSLLLLGHLLQHLLLRCLRKSRHLLLLKRFHPSRFCLRNCRQTRKANLLCLLCYQYRRRRSLTVHPIMSSSSSSSLLFVLLLLLLLLLLRRLHHLSLLLCPTLDRGW